MKNFLKASLLIAAVSVALWSCDNGAYDADPNKDNKGALNPLDSSVKNVIQVGSMQGFINGKKLIFSPAYYTIDTNNIRTMWGRVINDSVYFRTITLVGFDSVFRGKKDVKIQGGASFTYYIYDTVLRRNKYYIADGLSNNTLFTNTLIADENKTMRGTVNGYLYKIEPQPINYNDYVEFRDFVYYADERPFNK